MSLTTELLRFIHRAGSERDATRILSEMTRFVAHEFAVHRVSVYVLDDGHFVPLVSEYWSGETRPELWSEFREHGHVDHLPVVERMKARPGPILDVDPSSGFPTRLVQRFQIRPYLALPLQGDTDGMVGMVLIEGDPEELTAQSDELAELASFVSLAVQNVRAFQREQQRAREAEALLEVSAVLTHYTDPTRVLASVAQYSARATGFERASIFILDGDGVLVPTMSQFADGHTDPEAWEDFISRNGEVPACRRVVDSGEPLLVRNAGSDPTLVGAEWRDSFGLRSMLLVPLEAWGERFGAMVLDHREARTISDDQVRVALGVASHGAAAIGLARLLDAERAAKDRLAELDRLKTAFVATVSHELRTPLTTIVGFTQVLPSLVDGEAAEFVALMGRESLHLEALIANLLDTSRLEAGILDIRRDPVDVSRVAREAVDLVAHLHPAVRIDASIPDDVCLVAGDAPRLRQVLVNLLENACKYGGGSVAIRLEGDADRLRFVVDDAGPGVPFDEREAVFDRFHRLHEGQESGTGIGLHLVKALVEAHGGAVAVDHSPILGGARFSVEVPLSAPEMGLPDSDSRRVASAHR
ncbi:MAG TPA: ATP-binding protein [Acidimicrobiia bacterium]|nr:ATP-binding protein [Acidimicrobiia bacterium]